MFEDFYKKDRRKLDATFIELDIQSYIKVTTTLRLGLYAFSVICYLLSVYMVVLKSFAFVILLLIGVGSTYLAKRVKSPQKALKGFLIGDTFCLFNQTTMYYALAGDFKAYPINNLVIMKSTWNKKRHKFKVTLQEKRKEETILLYLTEKSWKQFAQHIQH